METTSAPDECARGAEMGTARMRPLRNGRGGVLLGVRCVASLARCAVSSWAKNGVYRIASSIVSRDEASGSVSILSKSAAKGLGGRGWRIARALVQAAATRSTRSSKLIIPRYEYRL